MSGEQITLVALVALFIGAILMTLAILTMESTEGELKVFGIAIAIKTKRSENSKLSITDVQETIKQIVWRYNVNSAAVLNGESVQILNQTLTPNGLELAYASLAQVKGNLQKHSVLSVELRDIKWISFQALDSRTVRIIADETWEWIYPNNQRAQSITHNTYRLTLVGSEWRIDDFVAVNI